MKQVTFRGTGQLNGPVIINKTIELEDKIAQSLLGPNRDEVKSAILAVHFPGVKIKPNQIGCEVTTVKVNNNKSSSQKTTNAKKQKKPLSFSNILLWILLFPFKLVWWIFKNILKDIWKNDHMSNRNWGKFN